MKIASWNWKNNYRIAGIIINTDNPVSHQRKTGDVPVSIGRVVDEPITQMHKSFTLDITVLEML